MTQEEVDKIADLVIEKVLLKMPEVIGNLMSQHAVFNEAKENFFKKYPEFASCKEAVAKAVEMEEGKDLGKSYEDILEAAVPEIRSTMNMSKDLDFETVQMPTDLSIKSSGDNGVI